MTVGDLMRRIEANIDDGSWPVGYRLPPERVLAAELGVARNTLRKGLRRLEAAGKIVRHVGRGSFVAERSRDTLGLDRLIAHALASSPADVIELRLLLEPWASSLAAIRATAADLERIRGCVAQVNAVDDLKQFEHWDSKLHEAIIASTRNPLLCYLYEVVSMARRQPGWSNLNRRAALPERRNGFQAEHAQMVEAICDRDAARAAALARTHLLSVRASIESAHQQEPGYRPDEAHTETDASPQ